MHTQQKGKESDKNLVSRARAVTQRQLCVTPEPIIKIIHKKPKRNQNSEKENKKVNKNLFFEYAKFEINFLAAVLSL